MRRTIFARGMSAVVVGAVLAAAGCASDPQSAGDGELGTVQQAYVGNDGTFTVPSAGFSINQYTTATSALTAGATSITIASATALDSPNFGPLASGDLLLVIQMQGATIANGDTAGYGAVTLNGAGQYEMVTVSAKAGAVITLEAACGLKNTYGAGTQIVRVPQVATLSIPNNTSIVPPAWTGSTGGVVAVHVQNAVTFAGNGAINATGRGFRGGAVDNSSQNSTVTTTVTYRSVAAADGAEKGEGIGGNTTTYDSLLGRYGRGAPANGGGGGDSHNAGGGGGANGDNGNTWTGQGVMNGAVTGGAQAWPLDPGFIAQNPDALTNSSGGGRGGYTYAANNANATTTPPGNAAWGGNDRREVGGLGGRPLTNIPASRIFMGGGGGAGDGNNGQAGGGGRGGGIVILMAGSVAGTGTIVANGNPGANTAGAGNNDAPGGGGAGGTIIVDSAAAIPATLTVRANGGAGGNQLAIGNESEGPGGGGGGGFVAITSGTPTLSAAGGPGGTTQSTAMTEFPANGATDGATGVQNATFATGTLNVCVPNANLSIAITDSPDPVAEGASLTYTVNVTNNGPSTATSVTVTQTLPAGVTFVSASGTGWTCNQAGGVVTCTRPTLASGASAPISIVVTTPKVGASLSTSATLGTTTRDPALGDNTATATTTIDAVNDAPVNTVPGAQTIAEDTQRIFNNASGDSISVTDVDAGNNPIKVTLTVANGTLTLGSKAGLTFQTGDGTSDATMTFTGTAAAVNAALQGLTYKPNANFNGADTLTVTTDDQGNTGGTAQTDTDTVTINVTPVQDAPILGPDSAHALPGVPTSIPVLANDTDPDGDPLTITGVGTAGKGTVSINNGTITYVANLNATGTDTFTYTVNDGQGHTVTQTVTVTLDALEGGTNDADGDGLPDGVENAIGTNPNDADSDDDGVPDGQEPFFSLDSDGDGLIDALDPDSDNDGLFDGTELGYDCSGAGTDASLGHCIPDADLGATKTDPHKKDTDGGGLADGAEDINRNGKIDNGETDPNVAADDNPIVDTDGDGLSDNQEKAIGTDPNDADSDDDGVPDGQEFNPADDTDGDGLINALDPDSDNDGLFDGTEIGKACGGTGTDTTKNRCIADADLGATKTNPLDRDTDKGGVSDGAEDFNRNGKVDQGETDPNKKSDDASVADADGDGLSDGEETSIGSNPNDADSDDDGLLDGQEPNPTEDRDGDGLIDVLDPDSDGDGLFDGTEAGKACDPAKTDVTKNKCIADADLGATKTKILDPDTDRGGVKDGDEDANKNGIVDGDERDPLVAADDKGCSTDADCGNATSGKVCVKAACTDGCRSGGNGCPTGQVCSSTTSAVGTCGVAGADGGPITPGGDGGPSGGPGQNNGNGAPPSRPGRLEGGGCACDVVGGAGGEPPPGFLIAAAAAVCAMRRRREALSARRHSNAKV